MGSTCERCRFVGGLRLENGIASWPLAEMVASSEGVTVQLRWRLLRAVFSPRFAAVFISWDQLNRPGLVRGISPGSRGIQLTTSNGAKLIFWCYPRTAESIEREFNSHGVKLVCNGFVMW